MKQRLSFKQSAVLATLLLSPIIFLLFFFLFVEWLNPVTSHIFRVGTIASQYAGGPKAGKFTFVARLKGGRLVDVMQDARLPPLTIGTVVCVKVAVRKRTEWKSTSLVSLEECTQNQ